MIIGLRNLLNTAKLMSQAIAVHYSL